MEVAVVATLKVSSVNSTAAVAVELKESLVDDGLSALVEGSLNHSNLSVSVTFSAARVGQVTYADANQELVEVDAAISVLVEESHEAL